jgi:rare lipoprotein A
LAFGVQKVKAMLKKLILTVSLAAAAIIPAAAQKKPAATSSSDTICSYYSNRYNGRRMTNGRRFNNNAMTAASRDLPMGTRVKITNVANKRSVVVTVTDRGPFVQGREISVTRRAAQRLGFVRAGLAQVSIESVK